MAIPKIHRHQIKEREVVVIMFTVLVQCAPICKSIQLLDLVSKN